MLTIYLESGMSLYGHILEHDRKSLLYQPLRPDKPINFIEKSYISLIRADERLPLFLEYKGTGNFQTRQKVRKEKAAAKAALKKKAPKQKIVIKKSRSIRQKV